MANRDVGDGPGRAQYAKARDLMSASEGCDGLDDVGTDRDLEHDGAESHVTVTGYDDG